VKHNSFSLKFRLKSTFAKLVLSYLIITILTISVLSIILYNIFLINSLNVIQSDSKGRLSQNINHLNLIRNRTYSLGQQLLSDSDVIRAIFGNEDLGYIDQATLSRKLNNIIESDSIIHSIYLYNAKTHQINDTFDNESKESMENRMLGLLKNYNVYNRVQFFSSKVTYKKVNGDNVSDNIITAIFSDSEYFNGESSLDNLKFPRTGAILINLDASAIQKSIATAPDQESDSIILDKKGNVLFDSIEKNFGDNIGNVPYIKDILTSKKVEDAFTKNIDGEKSLIVYKTIDFPDWTFINVYTYKSLFSAMDNLGKVIILTCIGILLIAFIFSFISLKNIYNPFKMLLNKVKANTKINENERKMNALSDVQYLTQTYNFIMQRAIDLESSVNDSIPMVKKAFLKKVIQGKYHHYIESSFVHKFDAQFNDFMSSQEKWCFSVVVFSMDELNKVESKEKISEDVLLSSIESLIGKMFLENFQCEAIDYEDNFLSFLIKVESDGFISSQNISLINKIYKDLQQCLEQKISCAIGMPIRSFGDIYFSYGNALELLKYRFVYGYGSFFCYDMEELTTKESYVLIDKEKEKLIQSIKMCDFEGVKKEIDNIIDGISQCQYDYIMLTLNQLMLDIIKSVKLFYENDSNELDYNNIYSNMNKIGTLDEMKEFLILYCNSAIVKIEKKKLNRKSDMLAEILDYIAEHFSEYDISTESLANMVNLTPGYFGKIFSESIGKTINEYIMDLRLSKAQELIKTTSLNINEISLKVGFNNSTYFATLFKKNFGFTPNQYRTQSK